MSADADLAACAEMIARGSKSFALAARLFDPETRAGAVGLYAWCRRCDDEIDGSVLGMRGGAAEAAGDAPGARLARLRSLTERALSGERLGDPAFDLFAATARRFGIPRAYPLELLEGMAMDVRRLRYPTFDDLLLYCYRVAGTVGLMMSHIMGVRDEGALRHACDLGLAMQLTNIARDVREDFDNARVYLPLDWLAAAGVPENDLFAPAHRAGLVSVVGRLLARADALYASGDAGLLALPARSAAAVAAARRIYAEIGRGVIARGADAWNDRTVVSGPRKVALAVAACADVARSAPVRRSRRWFRAEIRTVWKPFSSEVRT